jgi:hypothetical protein
MIQPNSLTPEEIGRRGEELYERTLLRKVEPDNVGRYLSLDINTGEYEIGDNRLDTVNRLLTRMPNATIYTVLVGYPAAAAMGAALRPTTR